tara:strand:- start:4569 stop:5123 length:555 start_codon:yes stop_codon:yes gene_type:complete
MKIETAPWKHFVFDDFLNENEREWLDELLFFFPVCTEENERIRVAMGNAFGYQQAGYTHPTNFSYHRKVLSDFIKGKLLKYKEFKRLQTMPVHVEYSSLAKGFEWQVHTDTPSKMFSLVLYLDPKDSMSCGTRLYTQEKVFHHEVEWKYNRAVAFFNHPDHHHDFYSNVDRRITLNFIFHEELL